MDIQVDANEVMDELTAQMAKVIKENAILKVQVKTMSKPQVVSEAPPTSANGQ